MKEVGSNEEGMRLDFLPNWKFSRCWQAFGTVRSFPEMEAGQIWSNLVKQHNWTTYTRDLFPAVFLQGNQRFRTLSNVKDHFQYSFHVLLQPLERWQNRDFVTLCS